MRQERTKSRVQSEDVSLPPSVIEGPSAWYGRDFRTTDEWIFRFTDADLAEIEAAVQASLSLPIKEIGKAQFPLPKLGPRLKEMLAELLDGRGFVLMRGLPVDPSNVEHVARAYWGIGAHLGNARSQNARGDLLGHVIDLSRSIDDPTARIYQTTARQNYHADSCDLVGLLCLQKSMSGGASSILSSVTIYNEMTKRRPDLARELFFPFYIDRRGEVPVGKQPWYRLPVFSWFQGLLTFQFTRPYT
ncbi:MAG: TauD/TfdA family dioxygenase, partial [Alphaproteobacteria bacterium]|nr:TauD/TfdA family dioxygenase [Alphaproteobacteria bacterium]